MPPTTSTTISCPICAEDIKREAKKCKFCGSWIEVSTLQRSFDYNDIGEAIRSFESRIDTEITGHRSYMESLYDRMMRDMKFFATILSGILLLIGTIAGITGYISVRDIARDVSKSSVKEFIASNSFRKDVEKFAKEQTQDLIKSDIVPKLNNITKDFNSNVSEEKDKLNNAQNEIKNELLNQLKPQLNKLVKDSIKDAIPTIAAQLVEDQTTLKYVEEIITIIPKTEVYVIEEKADRLIQRAKEKGTFPVLSLLNKKAEEKILNDTEELAVTFVRARLGEKKSLPRLVHYANQYDNPEKAKKAIQLIDTIDLYEEGLHLLFSREKALAINDPTSEERAMLINVFGELLNGLWMKDQVKKRLLYILEDPKEPHDARQYAARSFIYKNFDPEVQDILDRSIVEILIKIYSDTDKFDTDTREKIFVHLESIVTNYSLSSIDRYFTKDQWLKWMMKNSSKLIEE